MNVPTKLEKQESQKNTSNLITVSEIFGPTIQGEGELIGTQTIFVRTGGCDYRCSWCDTGYAVLPKYEKNWKTKSAECIFNEIETLSNHQPLWITLSGGNPAMQDLEKLIKLGQSKGYRFSMETQASISKPWFSLLDQLTLSPKPPSSNMNFKHRGLERCIDACEDNSKVSLKFVIATQEDLIWSKHLSDKYPKLPCFVQPCNTKAKIETCPKVNESSKNKQKPLLDLFDAVQALNWTSVRVLPQLHTWIWGNKSGV